MSYVNPIIEPTPTPTPTTFQNQPSFIDSILGYIIPIIIIIFTIIILYFVIKLVRKKFKNRKQNKDLLFKDSNVGKYSVIIFRKISDKYNMVDTIKIDIKKDGFRYEDKDFTTFDMNKVAYSDKHSNYYAFDYDNGDQLTFKTKGLPENITIKDIDIYVNRHVIADLVAGLEQPKNKGQWLMLIVGAVLGVGIGIIIGQYIGGTMLTLIVVI
jgi:hypothetical protein